MRWVHGIVLLVGLVSARIAHAEEPSFEVTARGATIQGSVGTSRAGYRLMGDIGGESVGIRMFCQHWLLSWDVLAATRLGVVANTRPYLFVVGLRGSAFVEPAYRFIDARTSPVLSARIAGDASILWNPATSHPALETLNDMDGVGGVVSRGLVRVGGGVSYLHDGRSLLVQGFAQESLQAHGQNSTGRTFTEGGVSARFDWTWGLSMALEARGGATPVDEDAALKRTVWTSRYGVAGSFRKIFANGMWLGFFSSIERDAGHVTYETTHTNFDVQTPADFTFAAALGIPLWRPR